MDYSKLKVLTFDCYGTLVDWESGIVNSLSIFNENSSYELSRNALLEAHAQIEATFQQQYPSMKYSELLSRVYEAMAQKFNVKYNPMKSTEYGNSVGEWPVFDDSTEALQKLQKHFKLAILSNVDNANFQRSQCNLNITFDYEFTAETIGSYKPDLHNFNYALKELSKDGIAKSEVLHVAESLFHDHLPANQLSLSNCRIYRRSGEKGYGATKVPAHMPTFDLVFNDMHEFSLDVEKFFDNHRPN